MSFYCNMKSYGLVTFEINVDEKFDRENSTSFLPVRTAVCSILFISCVVLAVCNVCFLRCKHMIFIHSFSLSSKMPILSLENGGKEAKMLYVQNLFMNCKS